VRSLQIDQIALRNQLQISESHRFSLESQLESLRNTTSRTPRSLNSPFKPSTPLRPSTPTATIGKSPEHSLQAQVEQTLEDIEALVGERELLSQVSHQALFRLSESSSFKRVTPKRPLPHSEE